MNEIVSKIKNNYKTVLAIGGVILVCFFAWYLFSGNGENVSSDRITTDTIRNEFNNAQTAERDVTATASDIAGTSENIATTVGNLADSINEATGASADFNAILEQCTDIIEQIRSQPAN